jgi:hypothetical protein
LDKETGKRRNHRDCRVPLINEAARGQIKNADDATRIDALGPPALAHATRTPRPGGGAARVIHVADK